MCMCVCASGRIKKKQYETTPKAPSRGTVGAEEGRVCGGVSPSLVEIGSGPQKNFLVILCERMHFERNTSNFLASSVPLLPQKSCF